MRNLKEIFSKTPRTYSGRQMTPTEREAAHNAFSNENKGWVLLESSKYFEREKAREEAKKFQRVLTAQEEGVNVFQRVK